MNNEPRFEIVWSVRGVEMRQTNVTQTELDYIKSGILFDGGTIESIEIMSNM